MNIEYEYNGRSLFDKYLKFRLDFVLNFCDKLLPNKLSNDKGIRRKLYNYYVLQKIKKIDFEDIINRTNSTLNNIFIKNNILEKKFQEICFCTIDISTLLEWKTLPEDAKEIKYRKSLINMATTIYIAMEYEKYLLQNTKHKLSFDEINESLINKLKSNVEIELLVTLKEKKDAMKKLFVDTVNKQSCFMKSMNNYELFSGKIIKINTINNENILFSKLNYLFKEFKEENKKEIEKISNRSIIRTSLKKIELDFSTLYLALNLLSNIDIKMFIEINNEFLSNKNNLDYLIDRISIFNNNIYINISCESLKKYADSIEMLIKNGIKVSLRDNSADYEKIINNKRYEDIKYFVLEYCENDSFGKILSNIRDAKKIPIVCGVTSKKIISDYKLEYYTGVAC